MIQKLKSNYNVAIARNGKEALDRMKKLHALDLIISDVMMDEIDGFDFCKSVNELSRYSHIPFIFLTAKARAEDRIRGLGLGAVDYVQKPFRMEELHAKIESILTNLKGTERPVVSKAYQSMLADTGLAPSRTMSPKRCAFTDNCRKYHLTSREVEIIQLLITGLPTRSLAKILTYLIRRWLLELRLSDDSIQTASNVSRCFF